MKKIYVGSKALKFHYPNLRREVQDEDCWTDYPVEKERGKDYKDVSGRPGCLKFLNSVVGEYPTPSQLLTLKVSHSFFNLRCPGAWEKHAKDIVFLQSTGAEVDLEMMEDLYKEWVIVHKDDKRRVSLDKTAKQFYADNVTRKYPHDGVHRAIMYKDRPMYFEILKDGCEVLPSKKKWLALSQEDKILCAREEITVTSLERTLIVDNFKTHPITAYRRAIKNLVCSMTAGWFPRFIMLNLRELWVPDCDYVQKFKDNIGKVEVSA